MTTKYNEALGRSNDRVILLAATLREAGIDATAIKDEFGARYSLRIRVDGEPIEARSLDVKGGYGLPYEFDGFFVRWDWLGKRGMGTLRYPLRKDGTVDIERLKGDIESFKQRRDLRKDAASRIADNQRELAEESKALAGIVTRLQGAARSGLYLEVENDGKEKGRLRFKVSGHASPTRLRAILAAVAATTDAPVENTR